MIACVSQPGSVHVSHNLEASNVLSPEQLQVVTTSSPPTTVEISGVCAAVQEQLEGGLAESLGLTNSFCTDSRQHSNTECMPHESHLDGAKGQS